MPSRLIWDALAMKNDLGSILVTEDACFCDKLRPFQEVQDRTIILPLFPQMSLEQQDQVVKLLHDTLRVLMLNE